MPAIGQNISHYSIVRKLGQGGMGEVYQAKDLTLGRDVAIKVLPEEFAKDVERVARFQREAKLLASLNHPNIAAIYGLEESGGTNFLVLELVEGETLADQLQRGPIPVEESLKLALQIAEALEAAHEKGVIHRDLKPANIKVTPDGKVKVLDFGLAKAFAVGQEELSLSASPTLSHLATQQGIILGTAAYMSPEQAKGKTVDRRTDIWAFGCVLYEMFTGQAAFQGEDVTEILAAVVKGGANLDLLPPNTYPDLRKLLTRCLQKDLKQRYQDIGDLRFELHQILAHPVLPEPTAAAGGRPRLRVVLTGIAAAVVVTAIITGMAVWKFKPSEGHRITRFSYPIPKDQSLITTAQTIAVSPDGTRLVCATNLGLFLRAMDQLDGGIIPGTGGEAADPFLSPDGQWVGYWSGRDQQLKKIPIGGGSPVTICNAEGNVNATWGVDNTVVFDGPRGIMHVSADGGTPVAIIERQNDAIYAPQILPDKKTVLFTIVPAYSRLDMRIALQSLASGKRKVLFAGQGAQYLPTGHLVYLQGSTLFAVPFDLDRLEVTGGPIPMIQGIAARGAARYAISGSGVLVYVPGSGITWSRILVWVDRSGKEEAIEAPPRAYAYAHLSPNGTRVALDVRDQENDIWIWDLARKTLSRLTFDPGPNRCGVWTPDGKRLAFTAQRDGVENIYWQAADGSGTPDLLTKIPNVSIAPMAFSPDGKQLLFAEMTATHHIDLVGIEAGSAPKRLFPGSFEDQDPQVSPDGRWIAYESNESGRQEVYVRPFPNVNAGRWQVSTEGGARPLWNRNGRELFYYLEPGTMMAVPVETDSLFKAGIPKVLFKGEYLSPQSGLQYSVTPDGQRFLMIKDAAAIPSSNAPTSQINIVLNWLDELKQRVPAR